MSLIDKINSAQGIALAALKGVRDINTYLETFVAPDLEGISEAAFAITWSSLVNSTLPSLLPISRFNHTINSFLLKTDATTTYVSNLYLTGLSVAHNNTINNILIMILLKILFMVLL